MVLTDLVAPAVDEWLVPALPLILREHVVVVAGVSDPTWRGGRRRRADDADDGLPRAAALAPWRRPAPHGRPAAGPLGATVIDARPGELAPALADTYLRVKATGRLWRRRTRIGGGQPAPGPLAGGGQLVPAPVELAQVAGDAAAARRPALDDDPGRTPPRPHADARPAGPVGTPRPVTKPSIRAPPRRRPAPARGR